MADTFTALVIEENEGKARSLFKQLTLADLPDDDVLVEVQYSALNYKDGLALCGNRNKVARSLPMVGGIDLAGTVVESRSPLWKAGDAVVLNGFGLSETHGGGYTRFQRVKAEWLVALPDAFTPLQAMAIGTAGYTAALCVDVLERWGHAQPGTGQVLVTGAAGGVGSVAVSLLAKRGYNVTASTGRPETHDYLRGLGASAFIDRATLRRMCGSTVPGKSIPPARPQAVAPAPYSICASTLASVVLPTESTAPAQVSRCSGRTGPCSVARSIKALAPRPRR